MGFRSVWQDCLQHVSPFTQGVSPHSTLWFINRELMYVGRGLSITTVLASLTWLVFHLSLSLMSCYHSQPNRRDEIVGRWWKCHSSYYVWPLRAKGCSGLSIQGYRIAFLNWYLNLSLNGIVKMLVCTLGNTLTWFIKQLLIDIVKVSLVTTKAFICHDRLSHRKPAWPWVNCK